MNEQNTVFINIDFTESKSNIHTALDNNDMETAKRLSNNSLRVQDEIKRATKAVGGKLVFESGMNVILYIPYDKELIEGFALVYQEGMGSPANIGVGETPFESHAFLNSVHDASMGNIVVKVGIKEDQIATRKFYKRSKKSTFDLKVASVIKSALSELNVITTDQKVYDIFMRLGRENKLNTIEAIESYYTRPLEEIKGNIRRTYESQKSAGIRYAVQTQKFPGQSVNNQNPNQRSPHKRLNWWSIEEYNKDSVDYIKTDLQHVNNNITTDSQEMSMGGEPGNAVYVP